MDSLITAGARALAPCCLLWRALLPKLSPGDTSQVTLLSRAFGAKHVDESHRASLRVEIGTLRKLALIASAALMPRRSPAGTLLGTPPRPESPGLGRRRRT